MLIHLQNLATTFLTMVLVTIVLCSFITILVFTLIYLFRIIFHSNFDSNAVIYTSPNLIAFWNLLTYTKWLVKLGLILFILIFISSYIYSRPGMFVEHTATIDTIEFHRAPNMRSSDSLMINYRFLYKNKLYTSLGSHPLPLHYPEEKVSEYVAKWR